MYLKGKKTALEKILHQEIRMRMFRAAMFVKAKNWKHQNIHQ